MYALFVACGRGWFLQARIRKRVPNVRSPVELINYSNAAAQVAFCEILFCFFIFVPFTANRGHTRLESLNPIVLELKIESPKFWKFFVICSDFQDIIFITQ